MNLRQGAKAHALLVANLGPLADHTQPRAGHVGKDQVERPFQRGIKYSRVHSACPNAVDPQAFCAVFQKAQLFFVNIAGENAPLVFHLDGGRKALAAGTGAGVQHPHARFGFGKLHRQSGGPVLHIEKPLVKAGQVRRSAALQKKAALRASRLFIGDVRTGQRTAVVICADLQRVDLKIQRRRTVVCRKESLGERISVSPDQFLRQPQGVTVTDGEVLRAPLSRNFREAFPMVRDFSQDGVDQAGGPLTAVLSAQRNRFVYRRADGHPVQKQQLHNAETQDVPYLRLQLCRAIV